MANESELNLKDVLLRLRVGAFNAYSDFASVEVGQDEYELLLKQKPQGIEFGGVHAGMLWVYGLPIVVVDKKNHLALLSEDGNKKILCVGGKHNGKVVADSGETYVAFDIRVARAVSDSDRLIYQRDNHHLYSKREFSSHGVTCEFYFYSEIKDDSKRQALLDDYFKTKVY